MLTSEAFDTVITLRFRGRCDLQERLGAYVKVNSGFYCLVFLWNGGDLFLMKNGLLLVLYC